MKSPGVLGGYLGRLLNGAFSVYGAFPFLLALFLPGKLVGIFTPDKGVVEAGVQYFAGYKYDYLLCALAFCVNGFLNGTGRTRFTLVNNIVSTYAFRLPLCLLAANVWRLGLLGVGYMLPVASLAQVIAGYLFFLTGRWKKPAV